MGRNRNRSLRIEITNPHARVVEEGNDFFIFSGPPRPAGRAERDSAGHLDDGVLVRVSLENGQPMEMTAARGVTTSFDLYVVEGQDELLVTDHFRTATAAIPARERRVPGTAVIDQLLFRTCPGRSTLLEGVRRLAHGERVRWRAGAGTVDGGLDACLRRRPARKGGIADGARTLEELLISLMEPLTTSSATANMLSGGVDSTLLQSFLPDGFPTISAAVDLPEYAFEVEYARRASELTGSEHRIVELEAGAYLDHLEFAIDNGAQPPHHLQTVLFDRLFREDTARFITAQLADAVFGLERAAWASLARLGQLVWTRPMLGRFVLRQFERGGPRARGHVALVRQLRRPLDDPLGFASMYATYTDVDAVVELFGEVAVLERLDARLRYTLDRLDGPAPADRTDAHVEVGQLLDFLCDDAVSLWRQLAHGHGKSLVSPFTSRAVVESSFQVPAPYRYARRGRAKPILKDLLTKRLPGYPVGQPKGASGLPFVRLYPGGPLGAVFGRYPTPAWLPDTAREICRRSPALCWNLIGLVIWHQRVVESRTLNAVPAAFRRRWPADSTKTGSS